MTHGCTVPLAEAGKPKLLDQVRQRCRLRHLAPKTEQAYVNWIRRSILFHRKRHPLEMGGPQVGQFLTHLAVARQVAASTQNQALSALLFLYREVQGKDFGWPQGVVRACWDTRTCSRTQIHTHVLKLNGFAAQSLVDRFWTAELT